MWRTSIAEVLSFVLVMSLVPSPLAAQASKSTSPTLQERIVQMPAGSIVEVQPKGKGVPKVRGRLGALAADTFQVQVAAGSTTEVKTFRFDEVKNIKQVNKQGGMKTAGKVVLWSLAIFGTFVLIMVAACWSGGCDS
ncbi:MAG: hypothetical protein HZB13_00130 [Acidobacteria bacterium]|nr:hypothetical protein [Acidobacteriota bacterium]